MIECLKTNKICPVHNRKCKICYLDDCKKVNYMLEIQERYIRKEQMERLNKRLPSKCRNCSHLEIINLEQGKVKWFYSPNGKCVLKE